MYVCTRKLERRLISVFAFAEHMLFYASEKYPLEDSYSKYIAEVFTVFKIQSSVLIYTNAENRDIQLILKSCLFLNSL